jgi:uncharacterized membrane protein required for colicin V production
MSVDWLDAAILLTFFWFGFTGFASGLLRSGVTLVAFFLGAVLAVLLYPRLASDLRIMVPDDTVARILALVAIFAATALAGQLVAVVLKPMVAVFFFGPLDGFGGLILGLLKAFILIEVFLVVLVQFQGRSGAVAGVLGHSLLAAYLLKDVPLLNSIVPPAFRVAVNQFVGGLP